MSLEILLYTLLLEIAIGVAGSIRQRLNPARPSIRRTGVGQYDIRF